MRALALTILLVTGCGGNATTLVVQVQNGEPTAPGAITVSVYDGYGLLGRSNFHDAALPGALTVAGLPDEHLQLRVVAIGEPPRMLAGARVETLPHQRVTETLTLRAVTGDSDGDNVPDVIDDCPGVADPDQTNGSGSGLGDACRGNQDADLGPSTDGPDLSVAAGPDLATAVDFAGVDLFGIDLATPPPPPDLSHPADLAVVRDLATPPDLTVVRDLATPPDLTVVRDLATPPDLSTVPPLFTEGWENGIMGALWTVHNSNGNVSIDPNRVHRGNYSLHVSTNAITGSASADASVFETVAVPLPELYVRVFAFVPSGFDPAQVAIIVADQASGAHRGVRLNLEKGAFGTVNSVPATTVTLTSTTPLVPTNGWVCLEWHIRAAASGFTEPSVNGITATALTGTQSLAISPTLGEIGIGLIASGNSAARDLWIDDVAVGSGPVGCQ